jgi:hypothetical protein
MRRLAVVILLLFTTLSAGAERRPRVILAVFAHPDDETFVGPVVARRRVSTTLRQVLTEFSELFM